MTANSSSKYTGTLVNLVGKNAKGNNDFLRAAILLKYSFHLRYRHTTEPFNSFSVYRTLPELYLGNATIL
jgi:hypothetical protein